MSCLKYIAGTLIAPNFAGYILSKGLIKCEEKKLIQQIEEIVLEFNRNFDDTQVDSNYFVDFLELNETRETIISRVFNAYKSSNEDYQPLAKKLSQEAVEFVNLKKDKFNHPHVKKPSDFEDYFSTLFGVLVNFRESLLSIKDKATISIIDESIGKSEDNIIKTIEKQFGNDYLLEQRIEEIEFLIDKGFYDTAIEDITEMLDTIGNVSKEQRVKLLYQKARIYINTDAIEKSIPIRKSIEHNCPKSKFIDEIDYWLGCNNRDYQLVSAAIQNLRDKGTKEHKLILKESNYHLQISDFDSVIQLLLDYEDNIKPILVNEASAYSQLGLVSLFRNEFEDAVSYFSKALKIKYNISYDYHRTIAKAFIFAKSLSGKFDINEEIKEKARDIYNDLERTYYFVENSIKEIRLQHWMHYLRLMGVDNLEMAIEKYKDIDKDLINEEQIYIVMSEIFFFFEDYENAANYLEHFWDKQSIFLARLLHCYSKLDKWELIEKIFEQNVEHLYDSQGVILNYKVQLFDKSSKTEEAKRLIVENIEKYKNSPWLMEKALKFLNKYGFDDEYEDLLGLVSGLSQQIELSEKLNLARTLINHGRFETVRELLDKSILVDDEALELYLHSYGEVNPKNKIFYELQQLVMAYYSNGNRIKYLLQVKFYIELFTERYVNAMESLSEYSTIHGKDSFYQVNLIQCTTLGSLNYDATMEVKELLNTDDLRHHIIVAQYFAYKGRWKDAKSVLRDAYYSYDDQIKEDEMAGFLRIYFSNIHQENSQVEYSQVCDDSVSILEDSESGIVKVSIHSNDGIVKENGEMKFECVNLMSTSDESYMLKATGKKGCSVEFKGKGYKVLEIIDLDTYFFRYYLQKIQEEYPENKTIIPISGETIEEMIEKTMVYMQTGNEVTKNKLKLYNFEIETGVPITYLSGKDVDKYLETVYFLMNNEEQRFYSIYSSEIKKGAKYVLTINSLVILNAIGYLDKVKTISDRLYVTPSIKPFVRKGIFDAIKYDAVVSTAFLDENNNFRMEESTEATKVFKKTFWTQVLTAINGFNEIKPEVLNTSIYDKIHEFVDISEFEAISIATEANIVLVCDDLFIAKICNGINSTTPVVNAISFLYEEELIDIDELIKLVIDLTKKKYLNCVNHKMLFDIYIHLGKSQDTTEFDELYANVSQIFENLFSEQSREYHSYLYRSFIELVKRNNIMSGMLYKLLEKPFGFKPYEELLTSIWSDVKIQFKGTDY
jgi:predicted nucleic acid-binding protein